jgi:hypothetical protein
VWHLLPPGEVIAAQAMREDDRRAGPVNFVIEIASVASQERHGILRSYLRDLASGLSRGQFVVHLGTRS